MSVTNPSFVSLLIVMACDAVFVAYFTFHPRPKSQRPRRARASMVGIALQMVACILVGNLRRSPTRPLLPMPAAAEVAVALGAAVLAVASAWMCIAAVRALGKQWTYVAEVGEGHQLVERGPYAHVRHPIYAGMTGLVIASAVVVSQWWAVPIVCALQFAGTWVRVRAEERLLREAHGEAFTAFAARVPAIVPRLRCA